MQTRHCDTRSESSICPANTGTKRTNSRNSQDDSRHTESEPVLPNARHGDDAPTWSPRIVYHIYPLGACGALLNEAHGQRPVTYRLAQLEAWIPHWQSLSIDTVYLGPVFASESHGYDTVDYTLLDSRLGDEQTLVNFVHACHQAGIAVVLDAVFNHVGRSFFAFQDVLQKREHSHYADWFADLRFSGNNNYGDNLQYSDWNGCQNLVKLNGNNAAVRDYLLECVDYWVEKYAIDGLRLDAADALAPAFVEALRSHVQTRYPGFWLLGEMVHGDYNRLLGTGRLHSVTNYELYKSLYSSLNDANFFELAYSIDRQWSPSRGLYLMHNLYTFVDNQDVNRVASLLKEPNLLGLLYMLLATLPGIPSLYYGSEWGQTGVREPHSDTPLRPAISGEQLALGQSHGLCQWIARLLQLRKSLPALEQGAVMPVKVAARQLAYVRYQGASQVLVCVNAADTDVQMEVVLPEPFAFEGMLRDRLDDSCALRYGARTVFVPVMARAGRVLEWQSA